MTPSAFVYLAVLLGRKGLCSLGNISSLLIDLYMFLGPRIEVCALPELHLHRSMYIPEKPWYRRVLSSNVSNARWCSCGSKRCCLYVYVHTGADINVERDYISI